MNDAFWAYLEDLCRSGDVSDFKLVPSKRLLLIRHGETIQGDMDVPPDDFAEVAKQLGQLDAGGDRDGAYTHKGLRFRANYFRAGGEPQMVLRLLPSKIPTPEAIRLPEKLVSYVQALTQGLVLVCGPTGCGKSTTIASLISSIMRQKPYHLVTLEDPIEYPLREDPEFGFRVTARQVGQDIDSFGEGLRSALRQAPRIILVGEVRDEETAENALRASQTGHLVFSTLHTNNAAQTIDRFASIFPAGSRTNTLATLSDVVRCVVCQKLEVTADERGRIAVHEIMRMTPSISKHIRDGNFLALSAEIDTGTSYGHQSFRRSYDLAVSERLIAKRPTT